MSIAALLTLVNNELIATGTLLAGTPLRFGPSPKSPKGVPPQVYWVPRSAKGEAPNVAMSRTAQLALTAAGGTVPRALANRVVMLEVHLWAGGNASGDDYSQVENLLTAVNSAIHHQCQGAYLYVGDDTIMTGTEAAGLGHKIIATFYVTVPLIELPATSPTGTAQSVTIQTGIITVAEGPIQPGGTTTSLQTSVP